MDLIEVRALRSFRCRVGDPPVFRTVTVGEIVGVSRLYSLELAASRKAAPVEPPAEPQEPREAGPATDAPGDAAAAASAPAAEDAGADGDPDTQPKRGRPRTK